MCNRKRRFSVNDIDEYKKIKENIVENLDTSFSDGFEHNLSNGSDRSILNLSYKDFQINRQEKDINSEIRNELRRNSSENTHFSVSDDYAHFLIGKSKANPENQEINDFQINTKCGMKHMRLDIEDNKELGCEHSTNQKQVVNPRFASYNQSVTKKIVRSNITIKSDRKSYLETYIFCDAITKISKYLYEDKYRNNNDVLVNSLNYLKKKIMICDYYGKKSNLPSEQIRTCTNILDQYLRKKESNKAIIMDVLDLKCVYNFIEQMIFLSVIDAEITIGIVKQLITLHVGNYKCIVDKCINVIISYTNSNMECHTIIGVVELLQYLSIKEQFTCTLNSTIFEHCILELARKDLLEYISFEQFLNLIKTFYVDDEKQIKKISIFIHKNFTLATTDTKLLLLLIIKYTMANSMFIESILRTFVDVTNNVLVSHNHRIIELLCEIYNCRNIYNRIELYISLIMPLIFDRLYSLTKNYWYTKGKSQVLVVLKKMMHSDTPLFTECLKKYNLNRAMVQLKSFDEEYTAQMFVLLSVDEENECIRRKSVLPDDEDNIFMRHKPK